MPYYRRSVAKVQEQSEELLFRDQATAIWQKTAVETQ